MQKKNLEKKFRLSSERKNILGLISNSPNYGTRTYAMWLGKSKARMLEGKKLDIDFRHCLSYLTIDKISEEIESLVWEGFLHRFTVGTHDLPVLEISRAGEDLLDKKSKKGKKSKKRKPTKKVLPKAKDASGINQEAFFKALEKGKRRAWVNFVNDPKAISAIEAWDGNTLQMVLKALQNMSGWESLVHWQLIKHPRKCKPLQRLLKENEE